jgi:hypothetical protein
MGLKIFDELVYRFYYFLYRGNSDLSRYFPGDCINLINQVPNPIAVCFKCGRGIYPCIGESAIKCGPCGNLFHAGSCWEKHRWTHGTSPSIGCIYSASGKITAQVSK